MLRGLVTRGNPPYPVGTGRDSCGLLMPLFLPHRRMEILPMFRVARTFLPLLAAVALIVASASAESNGPDSSAVPAVTNRCQAAKPGAGRHARKPGIGQRSSRTMRRHVTEARTGRTRASRSRYRRTHRRLTTPAPILPPLPLVPPVIATTGSVFNGGASRFLVDTSSGKIIGPAPAADAAPAREQPCTQAQIAPAKVRSATTDAAPAPATPAANPNTLPLSFQKWVECAGTPGCGA